MSFVNQMKTKNLKIGSTDSPAVVDQFNIGLYIEGLTSFIQDCKMPMTIAIQGDWGTGKTSVMNMVMEKLIAENPLYKDNCILFNTWQFSQFNLEETLPLLMLRKLTSSLRILSKDGEDKIKSFCMKAAGVALARISNGGVNDVSELFSSDFVDEIDGIKREFEKAVKSKVNDKIDRVVFFIDDLDRLAPGKAVELLEVMKLFLDCENCVFVLAIDYGVVIKGVKEKYGDDFDEDKGRSFFDKIIQVPFKMPVERYDINAYVKSCFEEIGFDSSKISNENLGKYVRLITTSIGNNPRSMKRLFNSYLLLSKVIPEGTITEENKSMILFALLCMQSEPRFENIYSTLISNRQNINTDNIYDILVDVDSDNSKGNLFIELGVSIDELREFSTFGEELLGIIDSDNDNGVSEVELSKFIEIINFSSITASSATETKPKRDMRKVYWDECDEKVMSKSKFPYIFIKKYCEDRTVNVKDLQDKFNWKNTKVVMLESDVDAAIRKRRYAPGTIEIEDGNLIVWSDWGWGNDFVGYFKKIKEEFPEYHLELR